MNTRNRTYVRLLAMKKRWATNEGLVPTIAN